MTTTLLLIDANNYIHRFYHAIPELTSPDGQMVNAVYGFCNLMAKIVLKYRNTDTAVAVVFDHGARERKQIYPEYKANRSKMAPDLSDQIPIIKTVIEKYGFPIISKPGHEADDIIASYAREAQNRNIKVIIASNGKDLLQLVNHNNRVFDPSSNRTYDVEGVHEKLNVYPHQISDFLALQGDSSDNISGVPGIGPKTAAKLLGQYGDIDQILQCLDQLPNKLRRQIMDHESILHRNCKITRLMDTLSLDVGIEHLPKITLNRSDDLHDIHRRYAFFSIIKKLNLSAVNNRRSQKIKTSCSSVSRAQIMETIAQSQHCSLAYRHGQSSNGATGGNRVTHMVVYSQNQYFLWTEDRGVDGQFSELWREILSSRGTRVMCHQGKKLLKHFTHPGHGGASIHDVEIMYWLTSHEQRKTAKSIADIFYLVTERGHWHDPNASMEDQLLTEAQAIQEIYTVLMEKIQNMNLHHIYHQLEMPLLRVIVDMELAGVKISASTLQKLATSWQKQLDHIAKQIYQRTNRIFNIGSPKQLADVLYDHMKLPHNQKRSTDSNALAFLLEQNHGVAGLIMTWRKLDKLKSAFAATMPTRIDSRTQRIHTTYNSFGTSTGRLSSHSPNLQNIPIKTSEGKMIRRAFVADRHYQMLKADYSQIELRILAYMANVETMLHAFSQDRDIHTITARELFHAPEGQITSTMRNIAKTINFSIIYGITPFGLSQRLRIPAAEAKKYIENYLTKYRGIREYAQGKIDHARSLGYVSTLHHRRCYIPSINSRNPNIRANAERLAVNATIQGTAADIIKKAMVEIHGMLTKDRLRSRIIMQVHDELVLEVYHGEQEHVCHQVAHIMDNAEPEIPLKTDLFLGPNWQDMATAGGI